MNIRTSINAAFRTPRRPRRARPRQILTVRAWNDLVEAILEVQDGRAGERR